MAQMKKTVKITGTAKSTGGNARNQPMKELTPVKKTQAKESLIQDITNRFRVTAREARDIVTAVGNLGAVVRDKGNAGALGGTANQLKAAAKEVKKQVGETAKAATSGAKGTPSKKYMTITGDQPARLMGSNKRR